MRLISFLLMILMGFVLVSCGGSQDVRSPAMVAAEVAEPPDTTLGPGDVFDVRVYGEEGLSNTFRVASDGSIDYPLIGTIKVNGLTPSEVVGKLETMLREGEYLKKPQVSIFVKEYNSKKISIFGQVKKPGTFPYQDGMSIVEGISIAGGFTSMARGNDTTVIRVVEGKKTKFRVPVEEIGEGKSANFILRPGDILFVPERIF